MEDTVKPYVERRPDGVVTFEISGATTGSERSKFDMTIDDVRGLRSRLDEILADAKL